LKKTVMPCRTAEGRAEEESKQTRLVRGQPYAIKDREGILVEKKHRKEVWERVV